MREEVFHLRLSIYKLLSLIKCSTISTFSSIFQALLLNLDTRTTDTEYLYKSLHSLIINNMEQSQDYLAQMLEEERFNIQEPNWKNPEHIGKMILMTTLFFKSAELKTDYPNYFERHVEFLKDIYPEYFLARSSVNQAIVEKKTFLSQKKDQNRESFHLESIVGQEILNCINKKNDPAISLELLKKLSKNILKLKTSEDFNTIKNLIQVATFYFEVISDIKNSHGSSISTGSDEELYDIFTKLNKIDVPYPVKQVFFSQQIRKQNL
jgi:hypothetical protein